MKITRMVAPAASAALIAATALALAPAASASTSSRSTTALPAASAVFPTPGKEVTITPTGNAHTPTTASLDWTIPACRGTVYATFTLKQGSAVYLKDKGGVATAYTCQNTPQKVTVKYSPADPSQGALSAGKVSVTTTTKPAATGSATYKTRTGVLKAVVGAQAPDPAGLPTASQVFPVPGQQATITAGGAANVDWTIPACRGTVYASFVLKQGSAVYLYNRGSATAYTCQDTPQTVTIRYSPADPSQGVLTTTAVTLTTRTTSATTGGGLLKESTTTLPAVSGVAGLPDASTVVPKLAQGVVLHTDANSSTGVTGAGRWVVPACTGTVHASFGLLQDGETSPRALAQKGAADFPCSPADQSLTVTYWPTDPSSPALHAGAVTASVDTSTGGGALIKHTTYAAQI